MTTRYTFLGELEVLGYPIVDKIRRAILWGQINQMDLA